MTKTLTRRRQGLIADASLYSSFEIEEGEDEEFARFVLSGGSLDSYCLSCEQKSVFKIVEKASYDFKEKSKDIPKIGVITITANCTRDGDNYAGRCSGVLQFCFFRDHSAVTKIGQFPSKADLDFGGLDPVYSKELDEHLRRELGRAVGLRSHGVGVGSFVYLRRIFESLIEEAHNAAKRADDWDRELYSKARMPEKIQLLKAHLPNRLVETAKLYGILSTGIHELSEETCLSHFDLVLKAILLILKERHEEREYKALVKNLGNSPN